MRTVLTEEKDTALYPIASLETAQLSNEKLYYFGEDSGRINKSGVSGYPTDNTTSPNDYIQQLSGSGYKIGTGIVLKVMAGNQVLIKATSWYNKNGVTPGTPSSPLNALISALISGVGGVTNAAHGITPTQLQNSGVLIPGATAFYGSHNSADSTTKPKAFLNWILLDDQFRYVASGSGFDQVGSDQQLKTHYVTPTMAKNGFLYVYVSNETPNINVYFDNLQVTHIKSPLLQEQSYYPFGLQMAGISDKALGKLDSKNKFDGGVSFEEDYGVNLYQTFYRGYDPQIGRFNGVDIMSEKTFGMSVYGYCGNNPVMFGDPMGSDAANMSHRGSLTLDGSDIGDAGYDPFGSGGGGGGSGGGYGLTQNDLDQMWNSPYGGTWSGGGGLHNFNSEAEGFGWGVGYMNTYGLWGSQSGWAKSFSAAYSNFSNSSDGPKGYNYATKDFSYIYASSQNEGDLVFYCGANYYFSGYGNIFDFKAIQEGYKLQQSQGDFRGMVDAAIGFTGGVLEIATGVAGEWLSGGTLTPLAGALAVDGWARITGNFGKFVAAYSGDKKAEDAIPGNIGALVGKSIDMATGKSIYDYGYGQAIGGGVNDVLTFSVSGGSGKPLQDIINNPTGVNVFLYGTSTVSYGYGLFGDFYPLKQ